MSKRTFLNYKKNHDKLKLNLGCGKTNQPEYWGIDIQDLQGVDEVCDLSKGIPHGPMTWDCVVARDFLEHISQDKCIKMMENIYNSLKIGGRLVVQVPSTDAGGHGAFQDPTHISFWNETKFKYFCDDEFGGFRSLYDIKCWFKPIQVVTIFNEWRVPYVSAELERIK